MSILANRPYGLQRGPSIFNRTPSRLLSSLLLALALSLRPRSFVLLFLSPPPPLLLVLFFLALLAVQLMLLPPDVHGRSCGGSGNRVLGVRLPEHVERCRCMLPLKRSLSPLAISTLPLLQMFTAVEQPTTRRDGGRGDGGDREVGGNGRQQWLFHRNVTVVCWRSSLQRRVCWYCDEDAAVVDMLERGGRPMRRRGRVAQRCTATRSTMSDPARALGVDGEWGGCVVRSVGGTHCTVRSYDWSGYILEEFHWSK